MIILYCVDTPDAFNLMNQLDKIGVLYEIHNNVDELISKGFKSLPVLEVDGKTLNYKKALKWLKSR